MYLGSNKVEIGVNNGSSSSDFSTAQVTIVNGEDAYITGAFIGEDPYFQVGETSMWYSPQVSGVNTLMLYKGQALLNIDRIASVTGDIEKVDEEDYIYLITGDCTITIL